MDTRRLSLYVRLDQRLCVYAQFMPMRDNASNVAKQTCTGAHVKVDPRCCARLLLSQRVRVRDHVLQHVVVAPQPLQEHRSKLPRRHRARTQQRRQLQHRHKRERFIVGRPRNADRQHSGRAPAARRQRRARPRP